jgi:addiction module RelE/StbE family toxin
MATPNKIEIFSDAQKDRDDIFNYIAKDDRDAAIKLFEEIDASIDQLKENPLIGMLPKNARLIKLGYRYVNVKNYLVLYTVKDNIVQIRHIVHGWLKFH